MVLEKTGMDGMNPCPSKMNQRRTFQQRMRTGKKTICMPGMQEQRTHGICPGNLQRHHGIQRRPGMEMTVPGMKDHVKTNMRKWPKTTLSSYGNASSLPCRRREW